MRTYGIVKRHPGQLLQKTIMINKDSPSITCDGIQLNAQSFLRKQIIVNHEISSRGTFLKVPDKGLLNNMDRKNMSQMSIKSGHFNNSQYFQKPSHQRRTKDYSKNSPSRRIFAINKALSFHHQNSQDKALKANGSIEDEVKVNQFSQGCQLKSKCAATTPPFLLQEEQKLEQSPTNEQNKQLGLIQIALTQIIKPKKKIFQRTAQRSYQYSRIHLQSHQDQRDVSCCGDFFNIDNNDSSKNMQKMWQSNRRRVDSETAHKKHKIFRYLKLQKTQSRGKNEAKLINEKNEYVISTIDNQESQKLNQHQPTTHIKTFDEHFAQKQLKTNGAAYISDRNEQNTQKLRRPITARLKCFTPLLVSPFCF